MADLIIAIVVTGICAFILGFTTANVHKKPVGTLRIDQSDPDEAPYLFLELGEDPRILMQKEYVMLKVNPKSYISHK